MVALSTPVRKATAARQIGITRQGFQSLYEEFIKKPCERSGLDPPEQFTLRELWAVVVARAVRQLGNSREAALLAMQLCNEVNAEEFYGTPLKEGRTCLLIVNGALCPRFFNRQDMESQEVRQLQVDAKALRCDFQVIDTRPVLEQLVMGIEADE